MLSALEQPIDSKVILRKRRKLRTALLETQGSLLKLRVAVLGGSTTSEVVNILELFLLRKGIRPVFYESGYNKFYEDALFSKELISFAPELIYVHTTNKNIAEWPSAAYSGNQQCERSIVHISA